jgi:hypothetical protein
MTSAEAILFEADHLFDLHIKLRRWDEQAKLENKPMPPLEKYKDMALRHLVSRQSFSKN